jgi:hypothetical protein
LDLLGIIEDAGDGRAVDGFRAVSGAELANGGREVMLHRPGRQTELLPNSRIGKAMTTPEQAFDLALGKAMFRIVLIVFSHRLFRMIAVRYSNRSQLFSPGPARNSLSALHP